MEENMQNGKPSDIQVIANNINAGLKAFEDRKAELTKLKEDAAGLTIESVNDTDAIKQVSTWRKRLKAARVEIEKEGKSMRDPLTQIGKSILEKQYELIDIISPTEQDLQKKEDWVKAENLKIEQEAQRKEDDRIQTRADRLAQYGFSIDINLLKGIDDEKFEETVEDARAHWQKEQDDIAEKERVAQEEREQAERDRLELKALREKQEEADRILKERQDELDRQEQELRNKQKQAEAEEQERRKADYEGKIGSRINQITEFGLTFDFSDNHYKGFNCFVPILDIQCHSDEEWAKLIAEITPAIQRAKEEQTRKAEEKRLQDIEDVRQKAIAEEKERQRKASEKEAEDKRLAEAKRQEDLEKAGDKAKWADFIQKLSEIEVPAMRSNQYRRIAAATREKMDEIQKLKP